VGHLQPSCLRIAFSPLQGRRDATEKAEVIQVPTAQSHLRFWRQKISPAFFAVTRGEQGESSSFKTQGCNFDDTIANPLAACQTAPCPPPSPLQDLIPPEALRAEGWSSQSFTTDAWFHTHDNSETANLSSVPQTFVTLR
jgi:hypothetical protein